jgi:uncharacterized glyoxalase superfamily protein PhnB
LSSDRAQVTPNLFVDSVEEARVFYMDTLGFSHLMGMVGKDGNLDFCIVIREGAMVMLARPEPGMEGTAPRLRGRPVAFYINVGDVDAYHDSLRGKTAIEEPLTTQWWGDRNFAVRDPYGYRIWFYQTLKTFEEAIAGGVPAGVKVV